MIYRDIQKRLPGWLRRHVLYWESTLDAAVAHFAGTLSPAARVLDAGSGEGAYAHQFPHQRYCGVDLGVGDAAWDYSRIDACADLAALPFRDGCFDACINIVTLEHVRDPAAVLAEIARTLAPRGRLLLIVPLEWEVHQAPHDFFRYTRHGVEHLLRQAGFADWDIAPAGGFFRLLSRRLFNALQFFPGVVFFLAALVFVPPALVLPWLDFLDRRRDFTLGYICVARKPA